MQALALIFSSFAVAAAAQGAVPGHTSHGSISGRSPVTQMAYASTTGASDSLGDAAERSQKQQEVSQAAQRKKQAEVSWPAQKRQPSVIVVEHNVKGAGANPAATDTVIVHYRGTLQNGTEFDSSYKRGQPISFTLTRVIPCWTHALQKMSIGGKATLTCPSDTAYGARAVGKVIPPNSDLTFEVELLGIN